MLLLFIGNFQSLTLLVNIDIEKEEAEAIVCTTFYSLVSSSYLKTWSAKLSSVGHKVS